MINVTKPFLPAQEKLDKELNEIWESNWLTNNGPKVRKLQKQLKKYLDVRNLKCVNNATIGLEVALLALGLENCEIITSPFSYVATTSSILLRSCKPVFVDIDEETLNIDVEKIREKITPETKAILAVHVFGNPCLVDEIEEIAKEYNLYVIYDAAHTFGAKLNGKSVMSYGTVSVCSFHATKLYHTVEGGCIVSNNEKNDQEIDFATRFGHDGDDHFTLGTNAKMSEVHAAMGLVNLTYIDALIEERKRIVNQYDRRLEGHLKTQEYHKNLVRNYAYYPVIFKDESELMRVKSALEDASINPRRYFYPSLNTLPYLENYQECPKSEDIAKRILCLPLYNGLEIESVNRISDIILSVL